jgi:tRNA-splicing ligase RtcB (3'-phosphate/5'-hydroxy nucleic acid ligase)
MVEFKGKYGDAIVYNDEVEQTAISQIYALLSSEVSIDSHTRIMPDVHAGAGCVIGYTAKLGPRVVPNLIGVDIGCGILSVRLGHKSEIGQDFQALDTAIRNEIPSGHGVRGYNFRDLERVYNFRVKSKQSYGSFEYSVESICKTQKQDFARVMKSLGTLGGGNHFIELGIDDEGYLWLTIHTGSRNFGLKVATYHQGIAKAKNGKNGGLEYLESDDRTAYMIDMQVAQQYAMLNRFSIAYAIINYFYKLSMFELPFVESVHNYINFQDLIVRKGAISAHTGEKLVIPFDMSEGIILGEGKGNEEWNYSAPHGAGRILSRSSAKEKLTVEEFEEVMAENGVWSSCISKDTLDESPMAYKDADSIVKYIEPSVTILNKIRPVYNFKASE